MLDENTPRKVFAYVPFGGSVILAQYLRQQVLLCVSTFYYIELDRVNKNVNFSQLVKLLMTQLYHYVFCAFKWHTGNYKMMSFMHVKDGYTPCQIAMYSSQRYDIIDTVCMRSSVLQIAFYSPNIYITTSVCFACFTTDYPPVTQALTSGHVIQLPWKSSEFGSFTSQMT